MRGERGEVRRGEEKGKVKEKGKGKKKEKEKCECLEMVSKATES